MNTPHPNTANLLESSDLDPDFAACLHLGFEQSLEDVKYRVYDYLVGKDMRFFF